MSTTGRTAAGVFGAALFPAAVVGVASLAPILNDRFVSMIDGRILTFAWWISVPLSVAAAVIWSRRTWAGIVLGVMCVAGFVWSLALADTTPGVADVVRDPGMWVSTIAVLVVPWAIGMIFGTTSLQRRPKRMDGTLHGHGGASVS